MLRSRLIFIFLFFYIPSFPPIPPFLSPPSKRMLWGKTPRETVPLLPSSLFSLEDRGETSCFLFPFLHSSFPFPFWMSLRNASTGAGDNAPASSSFPFLLVKGGHDRPFPFFFSRVRCPESKLAASQQSYHFLFRKLAC